MILVTGGCGFIGSQLVNKLVDLGNEVLILDSLSAGKRERLNKKAKFINGDVRNLIDVKRAMKGCTTCFHLAAVTDVRNTDENLLYQTNFLATKNVLDAAERYGTKIIFASTAAVYGDSKTPNTEEDECKPISPYGKYKLSSEKLLGKNPDTFIARLFNVYGPGGKSFVNKLCKKIPNYEEIVIYGNGLQTRDYIYISDVVDALLLGLDNSGLYNVGTGVETSILQLIGLIKEITNSKPVTRGAAMTENEINRSMADITKIKRLGWEPKISLEEGIRLVLKSVNVKLV